MKENSFVRRSLQRMRLVQTNYEARPDARKWYAEPRFFGHPIARWRVRLQSNALLVVALANFNPSNRSSVKWEKKISRNHSPEYLEHRRCGTCMHVCLQKGLQRSNSNAILLSLRLCLLTLRLMLLS
jgi:hypothetical protein